MAAKKDTKQETTEKKSRPRLTEKQLEDAVVNAYKGQVMSMSAKPVDSKDIIKIFYLSFGVITRYMMKGDAVPVPRFGKFEVHHRNSRKARNPQTGKPMKVAAHESPVFTASTNLKRMVNMKH